MIQDRTSSWPSTTIGEVVDVFDSIRIPLNSTQRAERQGPYPYYGASGVIDSVDDFLFNGEYVLVAEDGENLNSRKLPVAFMARGKFWVNNHAHIIKGKPGIADDRFLIAWFAYANISGYITGAAQPKLSQANLRRMELRLPSFSLQRKIASILSAYDDLIENNTRRIAILEEMAQAIYREWFVNFRFPGHENVKLVDSPLGQIPEGWEASTLETVLEFFIGGGWGKEAEEEGFTEIGAVIRGTDIPYAKHMNVLSCPVRFHKQSNIRSRRLQDGDIVFEVSGGSKGQPVGRSVFVSDRLLACFEDDVICASFCKLIRPNGENLRSSLFFHYLLESYTNGVIEQYEVQSTGIKNFKFTEFLARENIAVPPSEIQNEFDKQFHTIQSQIEVLGKKTAKLRTTRDLLLPKLISGKLDVEDLDIDSGLTAEALEEATA